MAETGGVIQRWNRRYVFELVGAVVLYVLAAAVCIPRAQTAHNRATRVFLLLAVALAIVGMAVAVIRQFMRIDEFLRRKMLEAFAVTAGVTAVWTATYGFFEAVGFPRLSMWWVWPVMVVVIHLWFLAGRVSAR